jgi:hypothetical protein
VSDPTVVDTTLGVAEIEFGINRWVLVTLGFETGQVQIENRRELASYLRRRGLTEREADDVARRAWSSRPRDAESHAESGDESLISATGLSSGTVLVLIIAIVVVLALLALYAASHWPDGTF